MSRPLTTEQRLAQRLAASQIPFIPRAKRIGRISPHREIMCRRCGRWMLPTVPESPRPARYYHTDDGTLACVDPRTLTPYDSPPELDNQPTEDNEGETT